MTHDEELDYESLDEFIADALEGSLAGGCYVLAGDAPRGRALVEGDFVRNTFARPVFTAPLTDEGVLVRLHVLEPNEYTDGYTLTISSRRVPLGRLVAIPAPGSNLRHAWGAKAAAATPNRSRARFDS